MPKKTRSGQPALALPPSLPPFSPTDLDLTRPLPTTDRATPAWAISISLNPTPRKRAGKASFSFPHRDQGTGNTQTFSPVERTRTLAVVLFNFPQGDQSLEACKQNVPEITQIEPQAGLLLTIP